jgi:aspartyl-tRNA(Asn)/glutamyl-tRNA(Gln) amidotransferase subunit B
MSDWKTIIGLEVHAELLTESKMFSACPVVDSVEAAPNSAVDALSLGLPGTLPVVNAQAIDYGMMVGLALNCQIPPFNQFARKSYFYPDLPKGYQISQYDHPLAVNGYVDIELSDGSSKRIRVRRAHLEEDTGKLTHVGGGASLVDYNRAGVPLLEIVTEPDIFSSEEAEAYARKLRALLQYLGVNHGDMSKGVLRFEANVSVMHKDDTEYRTRREIKNLNSIRSMVRAIDAEVAWQIKQYESSGTVKPATLGWDEAKNQIVVQRYKERADEYRYFPEPDLPIIEVSTEWVERVRASLPELPDAKQARYADYGITPYEARRLTEDRAISDYFEGVIAAGAPAKQAANWMLGALFRQMNEAGTAYDQINSISIPPANLAGLIELVQQATINNNTANSVLVKMWETGKDAPTLVKELGLEQVSDTEAIRAAVRDVLEKSAQMVSDYLGGKDKLFQALFGQCMKAMQGKGNPQAIQSVLKEELDARRA